MKIYISYWAQVRKFPHNLVILNTTMWPPKWYGPIGYKDKNGVVSIDCPPLKPGPSCAGLCNGKCSPKHPENCTFLKTYRNQLNQINFTDFVKKIEQNVLRIAKAENLENAAAVLLVYETPTNPCSERRIIQEWFRDNGMEIEEWQQNNYLNN